MYAQSRVGCEVFFAEFPGTVRHPTNPGGTTGTCLATLGKSNARSTGCSVICSSAGGILFQQSMQPPWRITSCSGIVTCWHLRHHAMRVRLCVLLKKLQSISVRTGIVLHMILDFPDNYPILPPVVGLCTPIPHPNVLNNEFNREEVPGMS